MTFAHLHQQWSIRKMPGSVGTGLTMKMTAHWVEASVVMGPLHHVSLHSTVYSGQGDWRSDLPHHNSSNSLRAWAVLIIVIADCNSRRGAYRQWQGG